MKHLTAPITGRCPSLNLNKASRTAPTLFLATMRMMARNKRAAKISGSIALLMLTMQVFGVSYTVNLAGFGSYNPIANHLNNPGGNDLNTLFPGASDGDVILY